MTATVSEMDILNMRTTNINVRISPVLKMKIMESGAKMGVNLSDYINYVLTKTMTGASEVAVEDTPEYEALQGAYESLMETYNELEEEKQALKKQVQTQQEQHKVVRSELTKYEVIGEQFKQDVGKPVRMGDKIHTPKHPSEVINLLLQTLQIKR